MPQHIDKKDSLAILGMGKVGTALGYLLRLAGYEIVAIADRLPENLCRGVTYTGGQTFTDVARAASLAECILITTTDDDIGQVCEDITRRGAIRAGKKVIHVSGAGGLDLLQAARQVGASVASIHPLQSFATIEGAINSIPGSTFGITADEAIRDWSVRLVQDLGGHPFFVAEGDKPLYHAAACLASNYLTTLLHTVEQIYLSLGIGEKEALQAFWPLVQGTLANIESSGTVQALTGPIARGDAETIGKHLAAFRERLPQLLPLYCIVGLQTVALGLEKKTLTPEKAAVIIELLEEVPPMTEQKVTTATIRAMKGKGEKIAVLTAYDYATASVLDQSGVEIILVGDSLGMVVLGYESTLPVTMADMLHHTKAVTRGTKRALVIADMPFMSYQVSAEEALRNAGRFLQEAGAQGVKLEGGREVAELIGRITAAGIPVMAHLGLTPQSVHQLGGYKIQGKEEAAEKKIMEDARLVEEAGAFALVLELVPAPLAEKITKAVGIPTIGIGAGAGCDGQVLVVNDMLGLFERFVPKFVKKYAHLHTQMKEAAGRYVAEVKSGEFPDEKHSLY